MELSPRKEKILGLIVDHFIATGEPVGSKFLSDIFETSISSATIRNEMSYLSLNGYLEQPYTSAGRIPSQLGYRYYVDHLMRSCDPRPSEQYMMYSAIDRMNAQPEQILADACSVLAELTGCAAVASTPLNERTVVRRVELIPLGAPGSLIVVVTSTGVVKTAVCRCDRAVELTDAELFYHIAGADFTGKRAAELNLPRLQTIAASLGDRALTLSPLLVKLYELAASVGECELIVKGQAQLLSRSERGEDPHELLRFIGQSRAMKNILRRARDGVSVLIGQETGRRETENASILLAPYSVNGSRAGTVALIGPMSLDYARCTASLSFMCRTVSEVFDRSDGYTS